MPIIQWFPGHMAKARREMSEALSRVDAVLEVVDARLPMASANPMLRELLGRKPKTIVMTRIDLADPSITAAWVAAFRKQGYEAVAVDSRNGQGVKDVLPALERVCKEKRDRDAAKGIRPRPIRTMVVGIPNVGKSSLINRMAGRSATKIGDRPGITKAQQWIRMGAVELLDTPGVLWPKLEDQHAAYTLAISGAIKSDVVDPSALAAYFLAFASHHYPHVVEERYGVQPSPADLSLDMEALWLAAEPVLAAIAQRRGLVKAGGSPDAERAAELLIREVQTGKLGRISLQWPNHDHS